MSTKVSSCLKWFRSINWSFHVIGSTYEKILQKKSYLKTENHWLKTNQIQEANKNSLANHDQQRIVYLWLIFFGWHVFHWNFADVYVSLRETTCNHLHTPGHSQQSIVGHGFTFPIDQGIGLRKVTGLRHWHLIKTSSWKSYLQIGIHMKIRHDKYLDFTFVYMFHGKR